jgi:hypothetical protein
MKIVAVGEGEQFAVFSREEKKKKSKRREEEL